jgi:hypothetical protein
VARQALAMRINLLTEQHPDVPRSRALLAQVLMAMQREPEGRGRGTSRAGAGPRPCPAPARNRSPPPWGSLIARVRLHQRDHAEAEDAAPRRALRHQMRVFAPASADTLTSLSVTAELIELVPDSALAREIARRVGGAHGQGAAEAVRADLPVLALSNPGTAFATGADRPHARARTPGAAPSATAWRPRSVRGAGLSHADASGGERGLAADEDRCRARCLRRTCSRPCTARRIRRCSHAWSPPPWTSYRRGRWSVRSNWCDA